LRGPVVVGTSDEAEAEEDDERDQRAAAVSMDCCLSGAIGPWYGHASSFGTTLDRRRRVQYPATPAVPHRCDDRAAGQGEEVRPVTVRQTRPGIDESMSPTTVANQ